MKPTLEASMRALKLKIEQAIYDLEREQPGYRVFYTRYFERELEFVTGRRAKPKPRKAKRTA